MQFKTSNKIIWGVKGYFQAFLHHFFLSYVKRLKFSTFFYWILFMHKYLYLYFMHLHAITTAIEIISLLDVFLIGFFLKFFSFPIQWSIYSIKNNIPQIYSLRKVVKIFQICDDIQYKFMNWPLIGSPTQTFYAK